MTLIAVLEDDPRRVRAMRDALKQLDRCQLLIFRSAFEMIAWLESNSAGAQIISLDVDLDATALEGDDCGSGEDVSAFLAQNPPLCPIIIHSSNALRAPAMHMELTLAGCADVFLAPFRDAATWASDVARALRRTTPG